MKNFTQRFIEYIEQKEFVTHNDKILLTVSGGVDSMVLMHLFASQGYNVGVAHCNFQLRGEESDEDDVLVAEQAKALGLECFHRRFNTLEEVEQSGNSIEMVARRQRYEWFDELCGEHGYSAIAIAHHINDSIETFFINLLRGTGLRGLTGITTHRGNIFRPLMFATRKEILDFAVQNKIPFREDSSNRSTKYLRNKVRLGLIPRIVEIKPQFTAQMRRNLARLTQSQIFIDKSIDLIAQSVIEECDGIYTLKLNEINESFPRDFVVYQLLATRFGFKADIVDSLLKSLESDGNGSKFYSKEFVAYTNRGEILVTQIEDSDPCNIYIEESAHRAYCGNSALYIERVDIDMLDSLITAENVALLDADKLKYPLTLRRWKEGDYMVPLGMHGRKMISDMLVDMKVSIPSKSRQFVLLSGDDIVWLVGRRIDERYKITSTTENVMKITKEII
ncbi:MAG: tRNA lysidine(34) synthetase TilS [Rikenellaceae bacterium]